MSVTDRDRRTQLDAIELNVNGERVAVSVEPDTPMLEVLRNDLGLTGAKFGCGLEQCRACAVLADGADVPTCASSVASFAGRRVTTVEGLFNGDALHPVQQAFLDEEAAQCGFCIPGMVIGAVALLDRIPDPTDDEIREALEPHLCRCGSHARIMRAVRRASRAMVTQRADSIGTLVTDGGRR
jgi:nicotinate dehydrogenase subunit A